MPRFIFLLCLFSSISLAAQKQDTIRHAGGKTEVVTIIEIPPAQQSQAGDTSVIPTKVNTINGIDTSEVYSYTQDPPLFPGGEAAYHKFVKDNLRVPQTSDVQGTVYVSAIIERNGLVTQVKIQKNIPGCKECDQEALRVLSLMPRWQPAMLAGTPVRAMIYLPVKFSIN